MEKKSKKENEIDLMKKLDEISNLKKHENKALKKIYDALQNKTLK